jgi:hypothetical protein
MRSKFTPERVNDLVNSIARAIAKEAQESLLYWDEFKLLLDEAVERIDKQIEASKAMAERPANTVLQ